MGTKAKVNKGEPRKAAAGSQCTALENSFCLTSMLEASPTLVLKVPWVLSPSTPQLWAPTSVPHWPFQGLFVNTGYCAALSIPKTHPRSVSP